eukprot:3686643-Pyramimonas_sp.AAC.1
MFSMLKGRESWPPIATRALRRLSQLAKRGSSCGGTLADCNFAHRISKSTRSTAPEAPKQQSKMRESRERGRRQERP